MAIASFLKVTVTLRDITEGEKRLWVLEEQKRDLYPIPLG